jgi:hypothetical protein
VTAAEAATDPKTEAAGSLRAGWELGDAQFPAEDTGSCGVLREATVGFWGDSTPHGAS